MTNKQKILALLEKECQRCIDLQSFTFANCHASFVANSLFLDRSNVSRILNELHREDRLIKLKGKPAFYFARTVIESAFPFASFPKVLSSKEELQTLLQFSSTSRENTLMKNFHLVGSEKEGSLHPLIRQILPLFYLPKQTLQVIVLQGNFGTGKKLFLHRLMDLGQMLQYFAQSPEIFFIDGNLMNNQLYAYLEKFQQQATQILAVATNDTPQEVLPLINTLHYHYLNQKKELLLVLLVDDQADTIAWQDITPFVLQFPDIRNRPSKEVLQIAQKILLDEAQRLKRTIQASKDFFQQVAAQAQNFHQLELLLQHSVANSLLSMRNQREDMLYLEEPVFTGQNLLPAFEELPDIMTISPEATMESLAAYLIEKKTTAQSPSAFAAHLLFQYSLQADQHAYLTKEFLTEKLISSLHVILDRSAFSVDPVLSANLQELILQVFLQKIPGLKEHERTLIEDKRLFPLQNKIEQQAHLLPNSLTHNQQVLISQALYDAYKLVEGIDIPIIIVSQYHLLAQLYVNSLNQSEQKRRCFYFPSSRTRPTEDSTKKNRRLYQFAYEINRGQGVLILTDQTIYKPVMEHFFLKTKVITYCLVLDSFALLDECSRQLKTSNSSLIPIIPNLLELAKATEQEIKQTDLTKRNRVNKLFTKMSNLFPLVDVYEVNDYFYRLLLEATKLLEIEVTSLVILEFRFIGNALIQARRSKQPSFTVTDEEIRELHTLLSTIQTASYQIPNVFHGFTQQELAPLAQSLQKHLDISNQ